MMWGNVHKLQNSMMNTISILPKKWCFVFSTYIKRVYILLFSCEVMSDFFHPMDLQPARLLCPWDFPDKSTGVDCPSLLQGIFPMQGFEPVSPRSVAGRFFTLEPLASLSQSVNQSVYLIHPSIHPGKRPERRLCRVNSSCL